MRTSTLLFLVVAVAGANAARDLPPQRASRALLQVTSPNATDCDRSVRHCAQCRYQFFRGTVTKAICTVCEPGYVVRASGRACYCAPGYYTTEPTNTAANVGFTCNACGDSWWCPGAKITAASSTARSPCGQHTTTTTQYAKSERECMVLPGYGWGADNTSSACTAGFYNPGFNTRQCTRCPGSLTTAGSNSNSSQECVAPIGSYYLRGKAVACARGTYKTTIGNFDCTECPTGMSTRNDSVSASDPLNCTVVLPGYAVRSARTGVTNATECEPDTYRSGETTIAEGDSVACTLCRLNMGTLPNVTRASASDACLAPPGYGWRANASNADPFNGNPVGEAVLCAHGWYNAGYNRQPCLSCGNGTLTTGMLGATAADQCYTPAGHGNRRDLATGILEGYVCPYNTYGRPTNTYGLVDAECTKCMENSHTNQVASTSQQDCVTDAGFGWDDGSINLCQYGYWNGGNNTLPCAYCGDYYNTSAADGLSVGLTGANTSSQCHVDFGFAMTNDGTVQPCLRGWFKDTISDVLTCGQCPAGTSTTMMSAAVARSDCDTCRPGFEGTLAAGVVNISNPSCTICAPGTYAAGFFAGGEACKACPTTATFSGQMVSRQGASVPDECFGEFVSDPGVLQNYHWWDLIIMSPAYLVPIAAADAAACQTTCGDDAANPNCQYFVWYEAAAASPDGTHQCFHRDVGADIVAAASRLGGTTPSNTWSAAQWDAPASPMVLFEVQDGTYAAYPAAADETLGVSVTFNPTPVGFAAWKAACDFDSTCIGLQYTDSAWRAFKGTLREGVVGKVRVVGNALNSWVPIPNGSEDPLDWASHP